MATRSGTYIQTSGCGQAVHTYMDVCTPFKFIRRVDKIGVNLIEKVTQPVPAYEEEEKVSEKKRGFSQVKRSRFFQKRVRRQSTWKNRLRKMALL